MEWSNLVLPGDCTHGDYISGDCVLPEITLSRVQHRAQAPVPWDVTLSKISTGCGCGHASKGLKADTMFGATARIRIASVNTNWIEIIFNH